MKQYAVLDAPKSWQYLKKFCSFCLWEGLRLSTRQLNALSIASWKCPQYDFADGLCISEKNSSCCYVMSLWVFLSWVLSSYVLVASSLPLIFYTEGSGVSGRCSLSAFFACKSWNCLTGQVMLATAPCLRCLKLTHGVENNRHESISRLTLFFQTDNFCSDGDCVVVYIEYFDSTNIY